jgi:hypothetical protein
MRCERPSMQRQVRPNDGHFVLSSKSAVRRTLDALRATKDFNESGSGAASSASQLETNT